MFEYSYFMYSYCRTSSTTHFKLLILNVLVNVTIYSRITDINFSYKELNLH